MNLQSKIGYSITNQTLNISIYTSGIEYWQMDGQ